jgi:histidyl-tRNA synthetase
VPRKERLFIAGMPQMIAFKGNNNEAIFRDSEDYRFFLLCLKHATELHAVQLHAYSLFGSQAFLLLSASDKTALARFTQHLGRCYVPYFNKRHGRSGALWEGRYRSCSIEPSSYFLLCQKYIETHGPQSAAQDALPVCNSAGAYCGTQALDFLTPHSAYLSLAPDASARHSRYRQFLAMPLGASFSYRIEECLRQNCVLGTLNYCLELEARLRQPVRPRLNGRPRKHYPDKLSYWLWLEQEAQAGIQGHGYQEIRLPLLSGSSASGQDQAQWAAMLRSEGTMGCLAAIAEQHLAPLPTRWWYQGPMFRTHHLTGQQVEQFHQIGAEALGFAGVEIELEQLIIQYDLIERLKLSPLLELQINTLGDAQDLERYRQVLRQHFSSQLGSASPAWAARFERAPETLLAPQAGLPADLLASVPSLMRSLSDGACARFDALTQALERAGIPFTHRQDLFPHQPYYQQTFFEWHAAQLDDHPVVCRGGRYDDVASRMMGTPTAACGFAFMVEPLIQLAEKARATLQLHTHSADIVILSEGPAGAGRAFLLGQQLRSAYPYLAIVNDYSSARWTGRLARAQKTGARILASVRPGSEGLELFACEEGVRQLSSPACVVADIRHWLN